MAAVTDESPAWDETGDIMEYLHIIPAYGRRYQDDKEIIDSWKSGKDFKIFGGPYCSVRDVEMFIADGYIGVAFSKFGMSGKWIFLNF